MRLFTELRAYADYLRDVRNDGLHPREEDDADRDVPFTEAGCTAPFMATRRYLVKLLALVELGAGGDTPSKIRDAGRLGGVAAATAAAWLVMVILMCGSSRL